MEQNQASLSLYPLQFKPIAQDKIWGGRKLADKYGKAPQGSRVGESWEVSTVPGNVSVTANGPLAGQSLQDLVDQYQADLVGQKVWTQYGTDFPMLVKLIDAADKLSVQVHPDDAMAKAEHGQPFGKNEMWYIMDCDPGAELVIGFNQPLTREKYAALAGEGKFREILQAVKVKKGDIIDIPAGRLHAICEGNLIIEIQQNSDTTYRIYDWDRLDDEGNPRELHQELAEKALDFAPIEKLVVAKASAPNQVQNVIANPYFQTNLIELDGTATLERSPQNLDSFIAYVCASGEVTIVDTAVREKSLITLQAGDSCLIPAYLKKIEIETSRPNQKATLLEAHL